MSSESHPINPARFAEALKDLSASSLALKVLELRNSIAHLDYSNAELRPFAEGTSSAFAGDNGENNNSNGGNQQQHRAGTPDQDCIDAIAENEAVIGRMQERIQLIRTEVESRGLSWREFEGKEDDETGNTEPTSNGTTGHLTNGVNGHTPNGGDEAQQHEAWRDGTFQTGTVRTRPDMSEEELLRQLQERMPREDGANSEDDDAEGGMHL